MLTPIHKSLIRCIPLTIACVTAALSSGGQETATATVPGVKGCLVAAFDDSNQLYVQNHCVYEVQSVWFFGTANRGAAHLSPNERFPTGVNTSQLPQLGSLRMFACPVSHPVAQTLSGELLMTVQKDFVCGKKTPHIFDAHSPRVFQYTVLTSGDCVLQAGALSFYSNGEARWIANIHTNHTINRDIWHLSFNVVDASGNTLFPLSPGDSPEMRGSPSPPIPWGVLFRFDKTKFQSIDDVVVTRSSC